MGRGAKRSKSEGKGPLLFERLPTAKRPPEVGFKPLSAPLWTENKSRLIEVYLRNFVLITKHGTYVDGFAAPQVAGRADRQAAKNSCAAKRVLESRPQFLRRFWLCDLDKRGVELLNEIRDESPTVKGRKIQVLHGDFNRLVDSILASGDITEKTATFCLLDQRTFECEWETVRKLAEHKKEGLKIEQFYFLGSSWLERAAGGLSTNEVKAERWWGRKDWRGLIAMSRSARAEHFRQRFLQELGYTYCYVWPICENGDDDSRVMYHMIHATDHERASELMADAYQEVTRPVAIPNEEMFRGVDLGLAPKLADASG